MKRKIILISGLTLIIIGIGYLAMLKSPVKQPFYENSGVFNGQCPIRTEERIVRGNSLTGVIEPGETVKILFGYYDCNEIKRDDFILYRYAGNENPLIKIVKGIPEDKFELRKTDGGWNILINGEILKNSKNQPYLLDERDYRMLFLYEKDYKGKIPDNAYLLLGNLASGSLDSTHFGLVDKSDILGKVEH